MLIGDALDTFLNITAFAFIGAMIWLLVRPLAPPTRKKAAKDPRPKT